MIQLKTHCLLIINESLCFITQTSRLRFVFLQTKNKPSATVQVLQSYHHNPQTESTQDDLVVPWIYECQCVFLCAISVIFTIIMLWSDNRKTVNFIFVTRIDIVYTMFSFVYHYYRYTCNYHRNVKNNRLIFFKLKSWPYKFIGYSSSIFRLPHAYNNFQVVILPRWFKKRV